MASVKLKTSKHRLSRLTPTTAKVREPPSYADYLASDVGKRSWGLIEIDFLHAKRAGVCVLWGFDSQESAEFMANALNCEHNDAEEERTNSTMTYAAIPSSSCVISCRLGNGADRFVIPNGFPLRTMNPSVLDAIKSVTEFRNNEIFTKREKLVVRLKHVFQHSRGFKEIYESPKAPKKLATCIVSDVCESAYRNDATFTVPELPEEFSDLEDFWNERTPQWTDLLFDVWQKLKDLKRCHRAFTSVVTQVYGIQDTLPIEMFDPSPMYRLNAPGHKESLKVIEDYEVLDDYAYARDSDDEDGKQKKKRCKYIDDDVEEVSEGTARKEDADISVDGEDPSDSDSMDI